MWYENLLSQVIAANQWGLNGVLPTIVKKICTLQNKLLSGQRFGFCRALTAIKLYMKCCLGKNLLNNFFFTAAIQFGHKRQWFQCSFSALDCICVDYYIPGELCLLYPQKSKCPDAVDGLLVQEIAVTCLAQIWLPTISPGSIRPVRPALCICALPCRYFADTVIP